MSNNSAINEHSGNPQVKEKIFLICICTQPYHPAVFLLFGQGGARRRSLCRLNRYGIPVKVDFEGFARQIAQIPDAAADKHFRSQHFQIYHQSECLVDFIGKFENLGDDWRRLSQRTGITEAPKISNSTEAGKEFDQISLSLETARLIAERYRHDIDILGYRNTIDLWLNRKGNSILKS